MQFEPSTSCLCSRHNDGLHTSCLSGRWGGILQSVEVSPDCLDMLTKLLVADHTLRMSMDDIKTHRWFLAGLPPGALDMNEFLLKGMEPQTSVWPQLLTHFMTGIVAYQSGIV